MFELYFGSYSVDLGPLSDIKILLIAFMEILLKRVMELYNLHKLHSFEVLNLKQIAVDTNGNYQLVM